MKRSLVLFLVALIACGDRRVHVHRIPPATRVRVFFNLVGAVDIEPAQVRDGAASVTLPPEATAHQELPLLSVEARRADGCLVANAAVHGWEAWLSPVEGCGSADALTSPTPR